MRIVSNYWRGATVLFGILFVLIVLATPTLVQGRTIQRPIQDFLSQQGTFCIDDGASGCFLSIPPDPNFIGWSKDFDKDNDGVQDAAALFAGIDYAGLVNAYPNGEKPEITGTVTERRLKDGRAEVTVLLHTKNANAWVVELDLAGDVSDQIANKATLFGHRPVDVLNGEGQALADTFLHVVFINTAPGAPLPDLIRFAVGATEPGQELKFLSFSAHAKGPLIAEFGIPEGTPGKCTVIQTGLFMTHGQGLGIADFFPAEDINLNVIGH
ncbi:MAG: hypothetical protein JETT_1003 [Candidatus Jettenia ecosi]|uniref:Uncharacterized protein n=1 Tax=Candidatus Jettenia ecosi TaxID=2494326 RepID=A0A533QQ03_9BACT|nr:MAG: hypothetical protein JETT_1003 [Candidatus Jettenia ecosi]